jgi:hypothetical protein
MLALFRIVEPDIEARCFASTSGATCALAGSPWSLPNPLLLHFGASQMQQGCSSS